MKITLAKKGGLAAGINMRSAAQVLDAGLLPKAAAERLAELVAAAKAAPASPQSDPGRVRDPMSYSITVEDHGQSSLLKQSDATMSPAFGDLLDWLENQFRESAASAEGKAPAA